jgi:hypothetical protein
MHVFLGSSVQVCRLAEVRALSVSRGAFRCAAVSSGYFLSTETVNRAFSGAVLREDYQTFAVEVEVHQREAGAQSVVVFCQTAIAYLVEAEDSFQDAEWMFKLGPHARLATVLCTL